MTTEKLNGVLNNTKLQILALHGYRQNSETFRQKTGAFRKIVKKWAEFTFLDAPHKVEMVTGADDSVIGQSGENERGWFFNRDDRTFRGIRKEGPSIGFEESVKLVEETFEKKGPFDGIWAFSQGACFLGLLCDLQQRGLLKAKFNFAVIVAGFKSGSSEHSIFYGEPIPLPSLHVFGEGDQIIPWEMSETLSECFKTPVKVKHKGGHFVPASSEQKPTYQEFFERQYMLKNS
ncbi:hypothetical protein HHI36_021654 [Cryptolaemus montrouzieri]|uniref:Serine hydrolase domain-containing protein n=1 Tax=Cryptolaemus montrouzieri TaxID=559131 RepID=A0ABD2MXQ7_9CUCU